MILDRLPAKRIRSKVISDYVKSAGYKRVVCISCGNAARWLETMLDDSIELIPLSEGSALQPGKWLKPSELQRLFPDAFNATSGHLPLHLMIDIGVELKGWLLDHDFHLNQRDEVIVPTGSGETIVSLALMYPDVKFIAQYPGLENATKYYPLSPLNYVVNQLAHLSVHK